MQSAEVELKNNLGEMLPKPRVRVVVLNWNGRDMTADCLRSLLAMQGVDFRILVIDNGSSDGSEEFFQESFSEVDVIANEYNVGFAAGCNIGMRWALEENAEYVLLVNNDTLLAPGLLHELLREAEANPQAAILSPKIYYFAPSDAIWWVGGTYTCWTGLAKHTDLRKKDTGQHDRVRNLDWATGCAMLLRCEALRSVGLFDEQIFGNGEDLDLSLRMRHAGYTVRYVPTAQLWHREGIDYRRNVGEHVRSFTLIRNLLWVMHKHAKFYHWLTFWPLFLCYYLPKMLVLQARRGGFHSCLSILHGVVAFWQMLLRPGLSVLPAALRATMAPSVVTAASRESNHAVATIGKADQ
jgi:GT2 family glycosyltransferase